MKYIQIDLPDNMSFYDSELQDIRIYKMDYIVNAQVIIKLVCPKDVYIELLFIDVDEYFFSWTKEYDFYTIESYKLFQLEDNTYYCSFDPADRDTSVSNTDGGVIRSKKIKGYSFFAGGLEKKELVFN